MIYKRGRAKLPNLLARQTERNGLRNCNQIHQTEALNQDQDLLYSGEALCAWPQEDYLRFLEELDSFGYGLKVLALVRLPYSYAYSAIQENIKSGKFNSLDDLNQPHRKSGSMRLLPNRSSEIEALQKIFGKNINFQPFSTALAHHNGPSALSNLAFL